MSRRRHTLAVALSLASLLGLLVVAAADSHTRTDKYHWFFYGTLYAESGNSFENNPLNVILMGGYRIVHHNAMLNSWSGQNEGNMQNWGCLELPFEGHHRAAWVYYPHGPGYTGQFYNLNRKNDEMSTSRTCDNQWHVRMWNAAPHNNSFHPGASNLFSLVGVHRETKDWAGGHHEISASWERAEGVMVKQLSEYCSWRNWRWLPGSYGWFEGYWSNGKVSRISPEPVSEPGPCGQGEASHREFAADEPRKKRIWRGMRVRICKKKKCKRH